jgi:CDP-glycerol glycerophosphotransferase
VEIPLLPTKELNSQLPIPVLSSELEGRVVRGPNGVLRLTLVRPIGEARGRYQQNRLRLSTVGSASALTRGVLMRSYFGEHATDNGLSIQRELQRRGSDLPVYWAVQDHSIPVPEGGIPVIVNSREFYELLASVKYYVDNMYQPEFHVKPPGQVIVQTFHGYPFKVMGHRHWRNLYFSKARIDAYDRRAAEWDYLVSPARYATSLLTQEFAYRGEVLEIGYPRNDILLSLDAEELRGVVRRSLGIADHQTAVLYAPTFRDYMSVNDSRARMADFFDFDKAHALLGDDYVILVRGHAFNARTRQRVGALGGAIDVTDYPEVSDLYLAADVGVVDYSSLRFDFGLTGKPMIFHVPDLQRYKDTRGWLFDFEPTAPGPLVDTTEQVVEQLLDLDGLRERHRLQYDEFRTSYLDLEDGYAGSRFVDAVFVPRGDA